MERIFTVLTAFVLSSGVLWANDNDPGVDAYDAGDFEAAYEIWRPMAEQGDAAAQSLLGLMYHQGQGVVPDNAQAARWYRAAAEQGFGEAQYSLGVSYYHGRGVVQDYAEAGRWFRAAAEQGVADAQFNLGVMYYNGRGVNQDDMTAHIWLNIAASNGDPEAASRRDLIADGMTPEAIANAQFQARICVESDYEYCY